MDHYPLSPNPIYRSFQGEGAMLGVPMVFVRLAGCSVGCLLCDTDYRVASRAPVAEIVGRATSARDGASWAWITGGEPTDRDLTPLVAGLRLAGFRVALATSGVRNVTAGGFDFLSVSPHDPHRWEQRTGDELKIVPGLNGYGWGDFLPGIRDRATSFAAWYAVPCEGKANSLASCVELCRVEPRFRLGAQAHKLWEMA